MKGMNYLERMGELTMLMLALRPRMKMSWREQRMIVDGGPVYHSVWIDRVRSVTEMTPVVSMIRRCHPSNEPADSKRMTTGCVRRKLNYSYFPIETPASNLVPLLRGPHPHWIGLVDVPHDFAVCSVVEHRRTKETLLSAHSTTQPGGASPTMRKTTLH